MLGLRTHGIGYGVAIAFVSNVLLCAVLFAWGFVGGGLGSVFLILFIGATQLIVIIPAIAYYVHRREFEVVKGIVIAAALTALVNGGCWVVMK